MTITLRRVLLACLAVPCGTSLLSFLCFLRQGGFGGGHGHADGWIWLLALPWASWLEREPLRRLASDSDLVNLVLLPLALNLVVFLVAGLALYGLLRLLHRAFSD